MWLWLASACDLAPEGTGAWRRFDIDGDGFTPAQGDCDDIERKVHPGADEACDGVDTDCDGLLDNGYPTTTWGPDRDGDGFGDATEPVAACGAVAGLVDNVLDCNDVDPDVCPGALDFAGDAVDTDCNGRDPGTGPIYDGSLELDDDASAIAFCRAYDGVTGSLTLGPYLSTTNWASCLTEVGDQLVIEAPGFTPERLGNLRRVGGALVILTNTMQSLEGLDSLSVLGSLNVASAAGFRSFAGIERVEELSGSLVLEGVPALTSLSGLDHIKKIGGSIDVSGTGIHNFSGLEGLEELGGGLYLSRQQLEDFEGLGSLHGAIEFLSLEEAGVQSFQGLEGVDTVTVELSFIGATVGSWAGLEGIQSVGSLRVDAGDLPPGFGGFGPEISEFAVRDSLIGSLEGLRWSPVAPGRVRLSRCGALTDLAMLRGVTSLPSDLYITSLDSLAGVDDLASMIAIHGDLRIHANASLENLDGLAGLELIDGDLEITANPLLDADAVVAWASSLKVGGSRTIQKNPE